MDGNFTSCCNSLSPSPEAACTLIMCDGIMLDGSLLQIEPDEIIEQTHKAVSYKGVLQLTSLQYEYFHDTPEF